MYNKNEQLQKFFAIAEPRSENAIRKAEERKTKRKVKELLLTDLCARLPYEVKIQVKEEWATVDTELKIGHINRLQNDDIEIKPYLRPMSSMTEEEIIEFNNIPSTKNYTIIENDLPWDVAHYKQIEWLNKNMFDYRGAYSQRSCVKYRSF